LPLFPRKPWISPASPFWPYRCHSLWACRSESPSDRPASATLIARSWTWLNTISRRRSRALISNVSIRRFYPNHPGVTFLLRQGGDVLIETQQAEYLPEYLPARGLALRGSDRWTDRLLVIVMLLLVWSGLPTQQERFAEARAAGVALYHSRRREGPRSVPDWRGVRQG
jgi:hypothetical protein